MALGAGSVTPLDMAAGYSVFANGGYRVTPYFITRVEDASGQVLAKAAPVRAGEGAQRAIDSRNAFVMYNMMQDVIRGGTGARAMQLGRDRSGRQDRDDQRSDGRLVRRLPAASERGRMGRLRSAALARAQRDRCGGSAADLDLLHGRGAQERCRGGAGGARRASSPRTSIRRPACATRTTSRGSSSTSTMRTFRRRKSRSRIPLLRPRAPAARRRQERALLKRHRGNTERQPQRTQRTPKKAAGDLRPGTPACTQSPAPP